MKVLVTGASGMVGRNLLEYLGAKGMETIPTDLSGWEFSGDLRDKEFVFGGLGSVDFDAIVHLAAITDIKKAIEDPHLCFEVNCLGTLNVLELGRRKNVSRFLLSSSANVYGAPRSNPVSEDTPYDPRTPYDYSKVVCEQLTMGFHRAKGLPTTITRSWLMFGEHDQPSRAIVRFIRACLKGEPLTLYNGGKDTTAPTHAVNFAKLVLTILGSASAVGEVFNFGGDGPLTVRELAETIRRLTHSNSQLILAPPRSELESTPQVSYPTTRKAKDLLGYKPELTLEEGLERTIAWVRNEARQ